jgi:hypothetical protein
MTSKREQKIQTLIQNMKKACNKCTNSKQNLEDCLLCEYHITMNELLKTIQDNGVG